MERGTILLDFAGTYGGATSRDEILRVLKEALALVETTPRDADLACAGLRIEVLHPGTPGRGADGASR